MTLTMPLSSKRTLALQVLILIRNKCARTLNVLRRSVCVCARRRLDPMLTLQTAPVNSKVLLLRSVVETK